MKQRFILMEKTPTGEIPLSDPVVDVDTALSNLEARRWYWRELRGYSEKMLDNRRYGYGFRGGKAAIELSLREFCDQPDSIQQGIAI